MHGHPCQVVSWVRQLPGTNAAGTHLVRLERREAAREHGVVWRLGEAEREQRRGEHRSPKGTKPPFEVSAVLASL